MSVEIKVPVLPESVANATVAAWYKKVGDVVKRDDNLVDIETDKVVLEVVSPEDGIVQEIIKPQGSTVAAQEVIAILVSQNASAPMTDSTNKPAEQAKTASELPTTSQPMQDIATSIPAPTDNKAQNLQQVIAANVEDIPQPGPGARRILIENDLTIDDVKGTGKDGRVTKEDVTKALDASPSKTNDKIIDPRGLDVAVTYANPDIGQREQKRVPMSRLRATIAQRLLSAQQNAAILTTFNEINMQPVMDLRTKYKEAFEKKNSVKLGFMSFFVKAVIEGLKRFPAINASIDGNDIVYHGFFDIGIAVASERGLLVPIIRDADLLNMAEIELGIADFGKRAQTGQIKIEEMTGGTFTISNGGVFGSLMSTPIINPPQSAILGMHKIEERPVVINNQIVIRPMMYVALSYDHRIIDGAESVQFLVTVKEILEDPARFLLKI